MYFPSLAQARSASLRAVSSISVVLVLATSGVGRAQTVDERMWIPNGPVHSLLRNGGTLYVGGSFTRFAPATGGGVPLDAATGAPLPGFPKVAGVVQAAVSDGAGGWYIGGSFASVGGVPRANLAHVTGDLRLSDWNPGADGSVYAIERRGSRVYAAGAFTSIAGHARNQVAELDAITGTAARFNPPSRLGYVYAIAVTGPTVIAGGAFDSVAGQARNSLAAFEARTGALTDWNPGPNADLLEEYDVSISALAVRGSTLYVGGGFSSIGGQPRSNIAAIDLATGEATDWNPNADGPVAVVQLGGSTVYVGGNFRNIGGEARFHVAALDASTGAATAFKADVPWAYDTSVKTLSLSGSTVYVGGGFGTIGGQARNNLAALDARTGAVKPWNPDPGNDVLAVAVSGSRVYAGGRFVTMGGVARNDLAALDVATGTPTPWNPNVEGWGPLVGNGVYALAMHGSTLYVGGEFVSVGGQTRKQLAAVDATTGAVTPWDPNARSGMFGAVYSLALSDTTVYASGLNSSWDEWSFSWVMHRYLAAFDNALGAARNWHPDPDRGYIRALAVSGSTLYAGGEFFVIGGAVRTGIAALDANTGAATGWNPRADESVLALRVGENNIYASGYFDTIGGSSRKHIAALDATTGQATVWNPGADGVVTALELSGSTLYAGGIFPIGDGHGGRILALDVVTGGPVEWSAVDVNGSVEALAASGDALFVGGSFTKIGEVQSSFLAAVRPATRDVPVAAAAVPLTRRLEILPNPFRTSTRVSFSLPAAASVTLEVFDVSGRVVATLLSRANLAAGPHQVEFRRPALPSGLYLSRLQAGPEVVTRKMLVLP